MRFEDERYVRLYTRDTTTWLMLRWEGQAVFALLLRKVDRTGVFDLSGLDPVDAVRAITQIPEEVVRVGLERLVRHGVIERNGDYLVVAKFIEAQEASMSTAARQKESRLRRRDQLRAGLDPRARETVIYFMQSEHGGPIKIGHAEDLAKRLLQLQTSRPDKLVVLASVPGTVAEERELHVRFAAARERGEWFSPTDELRTFVRLVAETRSLQPVVTDGDKSRIVTGHEMQPGAPCSAEPSAPSVPSLPPSATGERPPNHPVEVTNRDESRIVTGHEMRLVTPYCAVPSVPSDPSLTLPREGTTLEQALEILRCCQGDDAEALHDEAEEKLTEAGFVCAREFEVADRGDGRRGFVDLVVSGEDVVVAIELDHQSVREKSIRKLQAVPNAVRVIVLRAAPDVLVAPPEIDHVVVLTTPPKSARAPVDPSFARSVYHEGAQAGLRTATGNSDARLPDFGWHTGADVVRLLEAHAPRGLDEQGRLDWLRKTAEAYVVATYAEAKYQRGFAPSRCSDWLTAGRPPARPAPSVVSVPSAATAAVVSPSRLPLALLQRGSAA